MRLYQKITYFLVVTLLLSSCSTSIHRSPASQHRASNCLEISSDFFHHSNRNSILEIEPSSIAAQFRHTMGDLEEIELIIPTEERLLEQLGEPTTQQFFVTMMEQKNVVAQNLRDLATKYDRHSFFHQTLLEAADKVSISSEKRFRLLDKISAFARKPYKQSDIYQQNHSYYSGEIAFLYGEIGELKAAASFKGVESRGAYFDDITYYLDELQIPQSIKDSMNRGESQKEQIVDFLKSRIDPAQFDEALFQSLMDKEVDLILNRGHEWIEVKNLKHPITWDDLKLGGNHHKIAQQADKLNRALKMLGIRDKIKLKQTFMNCVDHLTATKFQELYGIEIVGCVQ